LKELGEYLAEVRKNHGVSIDEASEDLGIDIVSLENIESGNTRAFKDVYILKEYVRDYAKYLGLDSEKVLDEFNDFLFEHTSKISLEDILEAKRKSTVVEEEKKISSPYTKIHKKRKNIAPYVLASLIVILVLLILYLLFRSFDQDENISTELQGIFVEERSYECTY